MGLGLLTNATRRTSSYRTGLEDGRLTPARLPVVFLWALALRAVWTAPLYHSPLVYPSLLHQPTRLMRSFATSCLTTIGQPLRNVQRFHGTCLRERSVSSTGLNVPSCETGSRLLTQSWFFLGWAGHHWSCVFRYWFLWFDLQSAFFSHGQTRQ